MNAYTSPNRAYPASCLRCFAQDCFAGASERYLSFNRTYHSTEPIRKEAHTNEQNMVDRNHGRSGAYCSIRLNRTLDGETSLGMDDPGHLSGSRFRGADSRVDILVHRVQNSCLRCSTCRIGRCAAGQGVVTSQYLCGFHIKQEESQ